MRGVQKKKTFGWNLMKIYRIKFHDFIIILYKYLTKCM